MTVRLYYSVIKSNCFKSLFQKYRSYFIVSFRFLSVVAVESYRFVEHLYRVSESDESVTVAIRRDGSTDDPGYIGM